MNFEGGMVLLLGLIFGVPLLLGLLHLLNWITGRTLVPLVDQRARLKPPPGVPSESSSSGAISIGSSAGGGSGRIGSRSISPTPCCRRAVSSCWSLRTWVRRRAFDRRVLLP